MAFSLLQLSSLFIFFSVISHCTATNSDKCFRLTAAFNYEDEIYLVDGGEYIKLSSSLEEIGTGTMNADFDGFEGHVDAALLFFEDLYFFQGNNYCEYTSWWGLEKSNDNSDWSPFFEGGIDAAGWSHGESYFFRECTYMFGEIEGLGRDVRDIGLPCDIDAAWGHDDHLYVTKGDNVWKIDAEQNVKGPEKLSDVVTLASTSFCHEEGNPHTLKVRAEQKYERDYGCVILDAAINWYDDVFIFNDHEYFEIDSEGKGKGPYPIDEWHGLSANIDAGIRWSGNSATYFFKGSSYYRYHWGLTFGPFGNDLWAPFFEEGIDAAGNHDGQSYFFKGCEIASYGPEAEVTAVHESADLDLPCNVNAAFSRENTLYVIKHDQVWTWKSGEEMATGPASLSTVAEMSWTVCPAESE